MKNRMIPVLCLLLLTACGGGSSKGAGEPARSAPVSHIDVTGAITEHPLSDTIRMGRITEGEVIGNTVALVNSTASPMIVLSVEVSCGCTRVEFDKHPTLPSDTLMLSFEFDSRGFSGFQNKTIKVNTSLASNPCTIVLLGEVI